MPFHAELGYIVRARLSRLRPLWRPLLALTIVASAAFVFRSTAHAASVLQAADPSAGLAEVTDLVGALARVVAVALSIVGITGGIQGLIGGMPDLFAQPSCLTPDLRHHGRDWAILGPVLAGVKGPLAPATARRRARP